MRVLVAIDSFKGSLSSLEVATVLKQGLEDKHEINIIPISDGGEGFLDMIDSYVQGELVSVLTYGPSGNKRQGTYILKDDVAYIELDRIVGMSVASVLNPMTNSTYGLGLVMKDAIIKGATKIVLGLGGSATNDGGTGLLQAMGVDFYHKEGFVIKDHMNGELMGMIESFDTSRLDRLMRGIRVDVICDVKNPLLGKRGATMVYGRQKGASTKDLNILEQHMTHFYEIVQKQSISNIRLEEGTGAAGGVGFAAVACLHATLIHSISFIRAFTNIEASISQADVVIVGEGQLDPQSDEGKAPLEIARLAKEKSKKTIAVCGRSILEEHALLDEIYTIVPKYANIEASRKDAKTYLKKLIKDINIK